MTIVVTNELENLIIGGDFNANPWQRGTSFVSPTTGDYTADRFQYRFSGVQDFTITKDTDNPSFAEFGLHDSFSFRAEVTTANAGPGVTDFTTIEQPIEGNLAIPMYNNLFSLSFWVKSALAGVYCIAFQNAARTRSYIFEYTIASADTWQEVEMVIQHDSTVGVWEIGNLAGLRVIFTLNAGSSFQGSPNIWQAGDLIATSNQVNLTETLANDFKIALVRCASGNTSAAYWMRGSDRELLFAQRYYQKSYNTAVDPGTVTPSGVAGSTSQVAIELTGLSEIVVNTMRATPTVTWYSPVTGAINNVANLDTAADVAVVSTTGTGENTTGYPVVGAAPSDKDILQAHYTLEAEL